MILTLDISEHQAEALRKRAHRAELPLSSYMLAAAMDPLRYAWPEDIEAARPRVRTRSK